LNQLAIYYLQFEACWVVKVGFAGWFFGDEGCRAVWLSDIGGQQMVATVLRFAGEGRVWWLAAPRLGERPWGYWRNASM
jgi:hypothetical protein